MKIKFLNDYTSLDGTKFLKGDMGVVSAEAGAALVEKNIAEEVAEEVSKPVAAVSVSQVQEIVESITAPAAPVAPKSMKSAQITVSDANFVRKEFSNMAGFLKNVQKWSRHEDMDKFQKYDNYVKTLGDGVSANETFDGDGGFLVSPEVSANVFSKNISGLNLFSMVQNVACKSNQFKLPYLQETSRVEGSSNGSIRWYSTAEAGTLVGSRAALGQMKFDLNKYACVVPISNELLEDAPGAADFYAGLVNKELIKKLNKSIVRGSGSGDMLGILNSPALISVTRTGSPFDVAVLTKVMSRVPQEYWSDAIWLVNHDCYDDLLALTSGSTAAASFPSFVPAGVAANSTPLLFGRPLYLCEQCSSAATVGDVILFSPSQYIVAAKGGVKNDFSAHVKFLTDEGTYRWTFRADGQGAWEGAVTPENGSTTLSAFVTIAT